MAKTTEETPPEPKVQPNIDAIIALLAPNGDIEKGEKKQQDGMSELGSIYQRIEKNMQGNRAGVSLIRRMQKMSDDKRADFIRTVEPLMVHFGYTLDAIDPEDLLTQGQGKGDASTGDGGGDNAKLTGLDAARAKLSGGGDTSGTEKRASDAVGSVQLRKFIGALRAGQTSAEAAKYAELEGDEIEMHVNAEAEGEYADLDVITPPKKRSAPKLGIVAKGPETTQ